MRLPDRSLRFVVASLSAVCLAFVFVPGCGQSGVASRPSPVAPTAAEVKALVDVSYQRPALHTVVAAPALPGDGRVIVWSRRYDGVDLDSDARSTLHPTVGWRTHWRRELSEPEPVRRADVWTVERAAKKAGLDAGLASGTVKGRLVYRPQLKLLSLVPSPKNATDVELVVSGWRLVIELVDNDAKVNRDLDAYTGEQVGEYSQWVDTTANAPTMKYGTVPIDITNNVLTRTSYYRDPVRATLLDASGVPVNGQGIVSGMPTDSSKALSYDRVSPAASFDNDIAFALDQAWDFYAATLGRRGLRNRQPGVKATANDAIIYFNPTWPSINLRTHPDTGLIEIDEANGTAWQNWVTADVVGHEWTHVVFDADTNHDVGDTYWGANGGINEANSDLFGELIEARARFVAGLQVDDAIRDGWIYGQDSGATPPSTLRNMCEPKKSAHTTIRSEWTPDLDDPNPAPPATRVDAHDAAGPIDRVWCLLGRGMVRYQSPNDQELQSQYAPTGFPGLGGKAVGMLEYRALGYLRGAELPARFVDLRVALLDAAVDLYGEYSDEYKAVEDAFAAILVGPAADRTPPVITLTSGTLLNQNSPITVGIGSANPIISVTFALDGNNLGTLSAPPWKLTPSPQPEGNHTLYVTAVDAHLNKATTQWAVVFDGSGPGNLTLTDVTPCPSWWCGDYQYKRVYRVAATDFSGVASETLYLDGPPIASAAGASNDFTVNYSVGGQHTLRATAVDGLGNGSATAFQTFDIDLTPPTINPAPTVTADHAVEGRLTYNYCATDPSGWTGYLTLNGVKQTATQLSSPPGCVTMEKRGVPVGTYNYELHVFDRWNNDNVHSGTITLPLIPPTVDIPQVGIDTVTIGHVVVSTHYGATHGISSVALQICEGSACGSSKVFHPTNSSTDQSQHVFDVNGLTAGHTYTAKVAVTGFNGQTTTKSSAPFTIPTGQTTTDVVYTEQEPNDDWLNTSRQVPDGTNVIRGSTTGGDQDWFWMYVPEGKSLCVAGAITNNNQTCTTWVDLYVNNQGSPAGGDGMQLKPSRSAITSSDWVCKAAPAAPNNLVLVNVEGPGWQCPINYDILLQIR